MNNPIPPRAPGSGQNKKYRNRRRRPSQGQGQSGNPQQPQAAGVNPNQNNHPPSGGQNRNRPPQNNRNHHPQNRNNHQQPQESFFNQVKNLATSRVGDFYDELLNQHAKARKLYFEYYFRAERNKIDKLERDFFDSARKIREFFKLLKPWQKEELDKKIDFYPNDTIFTTNHENEEKNWEEYIEQINENPVPYMEYHLSPAQKERPSFKDDAEETYGEMEDYIQYRSHHPQK